MSVKRVFYRLFEGIKYWERVQKKKYSRILPFPFQYKYVPVNFNYITSKISQYLWLLLYWLSLVSGVDRHGSVT